jgi:hypothetical protein
MKRTVTFVICLSIAAACRNNTRNDGADNMEEGTLAADVDSLQFPILIEGGKKIVYQVGRMTPDKGLKLYLDTVAYTEGMLPDSLKITSLFPMFLSASERDNVSCVIVMNQQGYRNETILGTIEKDSRLHLKYKNEEIYLRALQEVLFKEGQWSAAFQNESLQVKISAALENTIPGDHLAGRGELWLWHNDKLTEHRNIFLVYTKQ